MQKSSLSLLVILFLPLSILSGKSEFFFRDGDRAMFLGDSITEGNTYSILVESYVLSRFPQWKIAFYNTGWSGDTMDLRTRGGLGQGFDWDLKPVQAMAVTIGFGMNDARAGDKGYETYLASADKLAEKFAAEGARVAFVTSSPEERYQEGQPAGSTYNLTLRKYSDGLKEVAAKRSLPFVDQLSFMIEVIEAGRKSGVLASAETGNRLLFDGVHPRMAGGWIMATALLKGLNAPVLVSSVEINAVDGKVIAQKAAVTGVTTGETLAFTRLDEALPWPVPVDAGLAAKIPGFTPYDDLSQYILKVSGLSAPKYKVSVDGCSAGVYTKEELASGLNLSQQAQEFLPEVPALFNAIKKKNSLYLLLRRDVKLKLIPEWIPKEVVETAREKKVRELEQILLKAEDEVTQARMPKAHQWTLTPES